MDLKALQSLTFLIRAKNVFGSPWMTNHTLFRCNPAVSLACSRKLVSDALAEKDIVECDHFDLSPCDRLDLRFCDLCRYSNSDVSPAFSFAGSGCRSSGILARARRELVDSTSPAEVACGHYRLRDVFAWRCSSGGWSYSFDLQRECEILFDPSCLRGKRLGCS